MLQPVPSWHGFCPEVSLQILNLQDIHAAAWSGTMAAETRNVVSQGRCGKFACVFSCKTGQAVHSYHSCHVTLCCCRYGVEFISYILRRIWFQRCTEAWLRRQNVTSVFEQHLNALEGSTVKYISCIFFTKLHKSSQ